MVDTPPISFAERPRVLVDGLCFPECPRWRDGWLYFSDMYGRMVYRVDESGTLEEVVAVAQRPGGIGWLPGGDMLVAAMDAGQVLRLSGGVLRLHADLSAAAPAGINDMVVDRDGRAYVARFSLETPPPEEPIFIVEPDGRWRESTVRFKVANGMILTTEGSHLIVAESAGMRLRRCTLGRDGELLDAAVFAQLGPGQYPDGIGGDDQGGVWCSTARGPGVLRVGADGQVTHFVPYEHGRYAYACALGGADGQTLFVCTAGAYAHGTMEGRREGAVEVLKVPFRRSGTP